MKKKVVKVIDGNTSSVLHYEDGTKETLPDGVFASFNTDEQTKDQNKEQGTGEDLMKSYRKQKKDMM